MKKPKNPLNNASEDAVASTGESVGLTAAESVHPLRARIMNGYGNLEDAFEQDPEWEDTPQYDHDFEQALELDDDFEDSFLHDPDFEDDLHSDVHKLGGRYPTNE